METSLSHSRRTARRPWFFETRARFFGTLFLVLALPTAILVLLTSAYLWQLLTRQEMDQNTVTARLLAKQVNEEFFGVGRYVQSYADRRSLVEALRRNENSTVEEQLGQLVDQNKRISRAVITDAAGDILYEFPHRPSRVGTNIPDRDWLQGAAKQNHPYVSELYQRPLDGKPVVMVATKIKDEKGSVLGYVGAQCTATELQNWIESLRQWDTSRVAVFDQHGHQLSQIEDSSKKGIGDHPDIQQMLNQRDGASRVENLDGIRHALVGHARISDIGWTIVAFEDENATLVPVKHFVRTIILFFIISLIAMGLLGWFWQRILFAYEQDLTASVKEIENLCYSMAHDFRAPLRAMQGFATALDEEYDGQLSAPGTDYIKRIHKAALRMDRLVTDLLDYGRVAHRPLQFTAISLDAVAERVAESFAAETRRRHAKIVFKRPLGIASGDSELLDTIFLHLLSNALKFVNHDALPSVEIWSEPGERHFLRVKFRDNGIGISPEYFEKIFGVFNRLHAIDVYPGTGIGLALVKKAVERMGGKIGVESIPGKGSTFWVELPRP